MSPSAPRRIVSSNGIELMQGGNKRLTFPEAPNAPSGFFTRTDTAPSIRFAGRRAHRAALNTV